MSRTSTVLITQSRTRNSYPWAAPGNRSIPPARPADRWFPGQTVGVRLRHGSALALMRSHVGEPPSWPSTVTVIGGGRMGSGIAEMFAIGGLRVRITDADPGLTQKARDRVIERTRRHAEA